MSTLDDRPDTAGRTAYDDWFGRGYLRGLDHGQLRQVPELAALLETAPALDDIRFRGEHLTVHAIGTTAYAVLWEEWFGLTSTWVRHASPAAARSWAHQVAAQWLRNETGYRAPGGTLRSWGRREWAAERDLVHGRWHVAVGLHPGVTYASVETGDPVAGWAFLTATLAAAGFPAETWPDEMLQTRQQDLPAPDPKPPTQPGTASAEPQTRSRTWREILRRVLASFRKTR